MIAACATNNPDRDASATYRQKLNDKSQAKLSALTEKLRSNSSKENNQNYISVKLYKLSGPGYGAILKLDQDNKENLSMTDVTAAITSFIASSGFIKVDCSSSQIACFTKEKFSLALEPTDSPNSIRILFVTEEKQEVVAHRAADTMLQFFFEILLAYLQQPSTSHKVLKQLN